MDFMLEMMLRCREDSKQARQSFRQAENLAGGYMPMSRGCVKHVCRYAMKQINSLVSIFSFLSL